MTDRDHRPKSSRARTDDRQRRQAHGLRLARSTTTASPSSAKARASARHSAGSVEGPCSPRSRTTVRLARARPRGRRPFVDSGRRRTGGDHGSLLPQVAGIALPGSWSTAPGQRMLARHFGAFVVPPSPYTPRRAGARGVGTPACMSPRLPGAEVPSGPGQRAHGVDRLCCSRGQTRAGESIGYEGRPVASAQSPRRPREFSAKRAKTLSGRSRCPYPRRRGS